MKTHVIKFVWSFVVIAFFLLIGVGYSDITRTQFDYLGMGIYKEITTEIFGGILGDYKTVTTTIGPRDGLGHWHGEINIEIIKGDQVIRSKVTMINGKMNGKRITEYENGSPNSIECYNMDKIVPCEGNVVSDIAATRSGLTAFEILEQKYPWYTFENLPEKQNIIDSFKLFITAIEKKLNTYTLNNDNFDTYFNEVDGSIDSFSGYSNWYQLTGRFASGENEARDFEFRRAVIERYTTSKRPIVDIIQNRYPNFRKQVENRFNINPTEFSDFCNEFDSKMDLKINIPVSDPFIIDSLDNWMGQIFSEYLDDDNNLIYSKLKYLFSQSIKSGNRYDVSPQSLVSEYLQKIRTDTVPVYEAILNILLTRMIEVDAIKLSVREACLTNQNVPLPPEIVTNILGQNTEGIRVRGLITFDGNDAITRSGIVWDTLYNPELTANNYINPETAYDFNVFIDNLIPGKRYFVRSYAVNKVSITFGNTMEFTAGQVSSNKETQYAGVVWKVLPNPADNHINVTFGEALPSAEISLYTMNGYQIYNRSYNNMTELKINSCDWPSGTYTIVLKGPKIKQTKRVIIQH